jgi:hypothetical protein
MLSCRTKILLRSWERFRPENFENQESTSRTCQGPGIHGLPGERPRTMAELSDPVPDGRPPDGPKWPVRLKDFNSTERAGAIDGFCLLSA